MRLSCNKPVGTACAWTQLSGDCLDTNADYHPDGGVGFVVGNSTVADVDRNCDGAVVRHSYVQNVVCVSSDLSSMPGHNPGPPMSFGARPVCDAEQTCDCVRFELPLRQVPDYAQCSTSETAPVQLVYWATQDGTCKPLASALRGLYSGSCTGVVLCN